MKSEQEIIHKIKQLKYEAQRRSCGFYSRMDHTSTVGNPVAMCELMGQARLLEWVIEKTIDVRKINWWKKACAIYARRYYRKPGLTG